MKSICLSLALLALGCSVPVAPARAADSLTTNLGLTKPQVGASDDSWGDKLNANADLVDALFNGSPALLVAKGGTGATTAAAARTSLGLGEAATQPFAAGAWTPAVSFSTPGTSSATYSTQVGHYTCIGDLVFVDFQDAFTPTLGTASGAFEVGPLPYAVAAAAQQIDGGSLSTLGSAFVGYSGALLIRPVDATHLAFLYASPVAGGATSFTQANLTSGAPHIIGGSIVYKTSGSC